MSNTRSQTHGNIRISASLFRGTIAEIIGYFLLGTKYAGRELNYQRAWELMHKRPPGLIGTISSVRVCPKRFGPWVRRHGAELTVSPERLTYELWRNHLLYGYGPEDTHAGHREQYFAGDTVRDCLETHLGAITGLSWSSQRKLRRHDLPIKDFLDATGYTRDELTEICGNVIEPELITKALATFNLDLKGDEGNAHAAMMKRVEEAFDHEQQLALEDEAAQHPLVLKMGDSGGGIAVRDDHEANNLITVEELPADATVNLFEQVGDKETLRLAARQREEERLVQDPSLFEDGHLRECLFTSVAKIPGLTAAHRSVLDKGYEYPLRDYLDLTCLTLNQIKGIGGIGPKGVDSILAALSAVNLAPKTDGS